MDSISRRRATWVVVLSNAVPLAGVLFLQWRVLELLLMLIIQVLLVSFAWAWLAALHQRLTFAAEHLVTVRVSDGLGLKDRERDVSYAWLQLRSALVLTVWIMGLAVLVMIAHDGAGVPAATRGDLVLAASAAIVAAVFELREMRSMLASFSFRRLRMHVHLARFRAWGLVAAMLTAAFFLVSLPGSAAIVLIVVLFLLLRLGSDLWELHADNRVTHEDARELGAIAGAAAANRDGAGPDCRGKTGRR